MLIGATPVQQSARGILVVATSERRPARQPAAIALATASAATHTVVSP